MGAYASNRNAISNSVVVVDKTKATGEHADLVNKMLLVASSNMPRDLKLKPFRTNSMFFNKKCTAMVGEPLEVEDKGFLSSSWYLQFEIMVQGDVISQVQRKDQEFTELHAYLSLRYPNALIPHLEKHVLAKQQISAEYSNTRQIAV